MLLVLLNKFTYVQALISTVEFPEDSMGKKEEIIYITYSSMQWTTENIFLPFPNL